MIKISMRYKSEAHPSSQHIIKDLQKGTVKHVTIPKLKMEEYMWLGWTRDTLGGYLAAFLKKAYLLYEELSDELWVHKHNLILILLIKLVFNY